MEYQVRPEETLNFASHMNANQAASQDKTQEKISRVLRELNESTRDNVVRARSFGVRGVKKGLLRLVR